MKLRLRLPPRIPQWLVAAGVDGTLQPFRLRMRWNGAYSLAPATPPVGQACVVVVDAALPYRRKLQRLPQTKKSRMALLRAAPDEFPLPAEEMLYGLGIRGAEGYLYALPALALDAISVQKLRPAIVLVAASELDVLGCLATFENYQRYGEALDLLRRGRFLSRRRLLQVQLGAGLAAGLLALGAVAAAPELLAGVLERRVGALRQQGGTLPALFRTTEKMAHAQAEAARLYASPEARLAGILAGLFASVPSGHSIRTLELKDGVLRVAGTGVHVHDWLTANGFPHERINVESMGSYQRFRAERAL
jgi:hypothetical protein